MLRLTGSPVKDSFHPEKSMANSLHTEPLLKPHEVMAQVLDTPEKRKNFARRMGVSDNHVDKWCRAGGTGAPSDLDRVIKLMQFASDEGSSEDVTLVAECVRLNAATILSARAEPYRSEHDRVVDSAGLLREASEAVDALMTGKPDRETLKELIELRDKTDAAINRLSAQEVPR
jgi:hypothetical protein